jgi:hypothetical protein
MDATYSKALNDSLRNGSRALGIAGVIIFIVVMIVGLFCLSVHPEQFEDIDPLKKLMDDIKAAEDRTCKLITRADSFIEGEVGPKGMSTNEEGDTVDTPLHRQFVVDAQKAARKKIPGILSCNDGATSNLDDRLTVLEQTLQLFVGPIFLRNFNSSINSKMACTVTKIPCFTAPIKFGEDITKIDEASIIWANLAITQEDRITAILKALTCYEARILTVIDTNAERLKNGQISDCEKNKAAGTLKA